VKSRGFHRKKNKGGRREKKSRFPIGRPNCERGEMHRQVKDESYLQTLKSNQRREKPNGKPAIRERGEGSGGKRNIVTERRRNITERKPERAAKKSKRASSKQQD